MPVVEHTELFKRSIGEYTDIVEKEMYTFEDRGGDSLTLRPEATAGIARALISNGLLRGARHKLWCIGPMFRHERPQKGRYRQFYQVDVEAVGFAGPDVDAELIALSARLWRELGLTRRAAEDQLARHARGAPRATASGCWSIFARTRARSMRTAGAGSAAIRCAYSTARTRRCASSSRRAAAHRASRCRVARALRGAARRARCHGRRLRGQSAPGARPRLLFPHRVRVDHRCARRAGCGLLGRPLRRPDRAARRGGDAGGRFCDRRRAVVALLVQAGGVPPAGRADVYVVVSGERAEPPRCAWPSSCATRCRGAAVLLNLGGGNFKTQFRRADRSGALLALILGDEELARGVVAMKPLRARGRSERVSVGTAAGAHRALLL